MEDVVAAASEPSSFPSTTTLWKACSTASVRRAFYRGILCPPSPERVAPSRPLRSARPSYPASCHIRPACSVSFLKDIRLPIDAIASGRP
ncbi:hypothetical protein GUJ93_ZPchr0011g27079 [Zizania palustris]|uniref:Uncharacterized protein n=1 Tax=Zizania palustris TaxID=103762 RepID=A0A8J6BQ57_ZIZPA|nr:hypothetical protein GUJ93_ZPchr0011g27079 [Zizania palustris]